MKSQFNLIFFTILVLFSQIYSNSLRASKIKLERKVWNHEKNGTEDSNGLWTYKKKGGGDGADWQIEAMQQSRREEMMEKANKTLTNGTCDWNKMVKQMSNKIKEIKQKKADGEAWEFAGYQIWANVIKCKADPNAKNAGGNCEKLAEITAKRVSLLSEDKTEDTWKKIDKYFEKQAPTCKDWHMPGTKPPKPKMCTKIERKLVPVYEDPEPVVRRFVTIEESIDTPGNC